MKNRLKLGPGRGVRDLTAYEDGFLVLAGLASDPPKEAPGLPGDYAIHWWNSDTSLKLLKELSPDSEDGETIKPETLLPLGRQNGKLRVLLFLTEQRKVGHGPSFCPLSSKAGARS